MKNSTNSLEIHRSSIIDSLKTFQQDQAIDFPFDLLSIDELNEKFQIIPVKPLIGHASSNLPYGNNDITNEELFQQLEREHLLVERSIPLEFIKRSQRIVHKDTDLASLLEFPTLTRISKVDVIRGDFGEFERFTQTPINRETELNSISITRNISVKNEGEFWRGTAESLPFLPGGVDDPQNKEKENKILKNEKIPQNGSEKNHLSTVLETIPPGFERGFEFGEKSFGFSSNFVSSLVKEPIKLACKYMSNQQPVNSIISTKHQADKQNIKTEVVDELLIDVADDEFLQLAEKSAAEHSKLIRAEKIHWAHIVDANSIPKDFSRVIPELAFKYPFELDTFQKQAVYHLEKGNCVFVAAHTSAGKTAVAEYAIALASKHMTKTIYTSPIKALSNQKFRDFKETFQDVGLLTGDVQIKPDAGCLIMTTEILRSMLYKGADVIRDVEFIIFDEVHYVNDVDRGHVWEEVIIMLPSHINLILLSATVPNTVEFADWVGRTKRRDIYVISTLKRPVPLEHYLYVGGGSDVNDEFFKIVSENKTFLPAGYQTASNFLKKISNRHTPDEKGKKFENSAPQRPLRSAPSKSTWVSLIRMLKKKNLLPVIMFTFSKKRCDEYAGFLRGLDMTDAEEKSQIYFFLEKSLARLTNDDCQLPQILKLRELLSRGIAVHHSGILPIMKEAVEILFSRGLVRVLFATETFAMGINMPAKTVVFTGRRKHDGTAMRDLLPGEYTQMSGRAGRRGLDPTGTVIIYTDELPPDSNLKHMILGLPTKLESQFKLTYNMILNLLRVEALRVEDMIKKSFSENDTQRDKSNIKRTLEESEVALENAEKLSCKICTEDIEGFYNLNVQIISLTSEIYSFFLSQPKSKVFSPGNIIIVNNELYRNIPAVYLRYITIERIKRIECIPLRGGLINGSSDAKETNFNVLDVLPYFEWNLPTVDSAGHRQWRQNNGESFTPQIISIEVEHVAFITGYHVQIRFRIMDVPNIKDLTNIVNEATSLVASNARSLKFDEIDLLSQCKNLDIVTLVQQRGVLINRYSLFRCLRCHQLKSHYAKYHLQRALAERLAEIQLRLSDNSLILLPQYNQRVQVLKRLNYIDENSTVQLKGRVACEFNTVDELIMTELVFENSFKEFEPSEIIALLSCMVFQEKSSTTTSNENGVSNGSYIEEEQLPGNLKHGKEMIIALTTSIALLQQESGLPVTVESCLDELKWGLLVVVYEWARGLSFRSIANITNVAEGSIVRCIVRLDETAREVKNAARIIGDSVLLKKMDEASIGIKRDICFASSLYI